jgi:hypothetical protein
MNKDPSLPRPVLQNTTTYSEKHLFFDRGTGSSADVRLQFLASDTATRARFRLVTFGNAAQFLNRPNWYSDRQDSGNGNGRALHGGLDEPGSGSRYQWGTTNNGLGGFVVDVNDRPRRLSQPSVEPYDQFVPQTIRNAQREVFPNIRVDGGAAQSTRASRRPQIHE